MKKILPLICMLLIYGMTSVAQCDKRVILTSSKTEYLDGSGNEQRVDDEKSTIEISKTEITINPGNSDHKITGVISSQTCEWKVPFKEGKTVVKAALSENGEVRNATITIEGKNGKVIVLFEVTEMPDKKIRLVADSFEEKKEGN